MVIIFFSKTDSSAFIFQALILEKGEVIPINLKIYTPQLSRLPRLCFQNWSLYNSNLSRPRSFRNAIFTIFLTMLKRNIFDISAPPKLRFKQLRMCKLSLALYHPHLTDQVLFWNDNNISNTPTSYIIRS